MKKNKMMRLASILLVCVLLTTSVISGTFAKYVTSDWAKDTARVAKFGVVVAASGSLYDKNYFDQANENIPAGAASTNLTVVSSNADKLVAPGTQNDTGLTFSITGEPEVAVKLEVKLTDANGDPIGEDDDIYLKAKNGLPDMTTGDENDTFNNGTDYYPVVFTLTKGGSQVAQGKLSDIAAYMNGGDMNNPLIPANTNLGTTYGTYTLTWKWDFGTGTYDKQDTLLGDLAAGTTLKPTTVLTEVTDYNLKSSVKVSITVTQVD